MAEVYLCVAHGPMGFNKLAVVKRLRPALAAENEGRFVDMFLDEARLAARLNHQNVIHTYEVGGGEADGYFIAMEYLDGQPLSRIARATRTQPLKPQVSAYIIAEALAGLHYAHELADYDGTPLNVVHRDVSPQNIFVTYDGQVKLVDFGIAKAARNTVQTEAGTLKGKVCYMAPEQAARGVAVDRRADVFAMGLVLWGLLAGRRYFDGDMTDTMSVLLRFDSKSWPLQRVSTVVKTVDPALDDVVARALEYDPEKRFATALEMRQALEVYLRNSSDGASREEVGSLLMSIFAEHRERVQRQVREYMKSTSTQISMDSGALGPDSAALHSRVEARGNEITQHLPTLDVSIDTSDSKLTTGGGLKTRVSLPLGGVLAGVILLLAIGTILYFWNKSPPVTAASVTPPSPPVEHQPATPDISVRVTTVPVGARLEIDGRPVTNPFVGTFPKDDLQHAIVADAEKYAASARMVAFDKDVVLELVLEAIEPAASSASSPPPPPTPRPKAPIAMPKPHPTTKASPAVTQESWKQNGTRPRLDQDPYSH